MPSISPLPAAKTFSDSATAVQSSLSHIGPQLAENATVIFIERIFMDAASVFLVVGAIYACAVFIFPCLAKNLPQDTLDTMLRIQKMLRCENMPIDVYKHLLGRYQRLHKDIIATIVIGSQNDNKFDPFRRITRSRAWTKANMEAHRLLKDAKLLAMTPDIWAIDMAIEKPYERSVPSNECHRFIEDIDQLHDFLQAPLHSNGSRNRPSSRGNSLSPRHFL